LGSLRSGGRRKLSRIHETMSLQIGLPSSDEVDAEAVHCVHAEENGSDDVGAGWDAIHPDHPLEVLGGDRSVSRLITDRVRRERDDYPGATVTVVMGDRINNRLIDALSHRHSLAIKARLLLEPGVVVTDLNVLRRSLRTALAPVPINRVEQVVLISDLTRPIREALSYALGRELRSPPSTSTSTMSGEISGLSAHPLRPKPSPSGARRSRPCAAPVRAAPSPCPAAPWLSS